MNTLIARLGFTITVNTYMALRRAISHALVRYRLRVDSDGSSIGITEFLSRKTKGAKKFRKILNKQGAPNKMLEKQNATALVNKFIDTCGLPMPAFENDCRKRILSWWTRTYLPIEVRVFAYQLCNNSLPVGARMENRYRLGANRIVNSNCPFCTVDNYNVPCRETFRHLYLDCTETQKVMKCILKHI